MRKQDETIKETVLNICQGTIEIALQNLNVLNQQIINWTKLLNVKDKIDCLQWVRVYDEVIKCANHGSTQLEKLNICYRLISAIEIESKEIEDEGN